MMSEANFCDFMLCSWAAARSSSVFKDACFTALAMMSLVSFFLTKDGVALLLRDANCGRCLDGSEVDPEGA